MSSRVIGSGKQVLFWGSVFLPSLCYFSSRMQWQRILLSFFVSLALLASTLAACNAHLSATEHPDCVQCLAASSPRREDGMPIHLPVGPHHCPDHPCVHLHALFLVESGTMLPSLVVSWFFLPPLALHGQELSLGLLRPPQA
jgi:hypothetical protein